MTIVQEFCQDISKYYPDKKDFYGWFVAFSVFNGILSLFAIFGNTIIICALTKTTCSLSPSKILLLGLAISDLGVGLVVQPLYITVVLVLLGDSSAVSQCQSRIAFLVVGLFLAGVSFFTVSAISFDRFLAITLHLRYKEIVTEKKVTLVLAVLWALSALAAIGYLFMGDVTREAVSTTFTIIFFVTTTLTFVRIYLAVRRHRLQIRTQQRPIEECYKELALSKKKFKSAMSVLYVYIVFTACYLPYANTLMIMATTSPGLALKGIFHLTMTFGFLNSSLNPIIYCWRMREIRGYVMEILARIFPCLKKDQVTQISPDSILTSYFRRDESTVNR
ncbi:melanocyte-stimulating hormone receptor-like [Oculina patagonica]